MLALGLLMVGVPVFAALALIWFLLARSPTRDPDEDRRQPPPAERPPR